MKRFGTAAAAILFAVIFAGSALAQAGQPGVGRIGLIDSGAFGDEKEGITKYLNAVKALNLEVKPKVDELNGMQTRLKAISDELEKIKNPPANVPINTSLAQTKQADGESLQRQFEFKKKDYDAYLEKRGNDLLGPIQLDIGKAIQDFCTQKGYVAILDLDKMGRDGSLLGLDPKANVTKEFITFYNTRPATTASTVTPK